MKVYTLVVCGSAFWLFLLSLAVLMIQKFGFYDGETGFVMDSVLLLAIPTAMMALTIAIGWFAKRRTLSKTAILASSVAAIGATLWWGEIWGQSI